MSHYGLKQRTCLHCLGLSQYSQPNLKTGKDISGVFLLTDGHCFKDRR